MNIERVVLRAAVGRDNYPRVEQVASMLDELAERQVIAPEGRDALVALLANEIVTASVLRECGCDLSSLSGERDTPTPEDPTCISFDSDSSTRLTCSPRSRS
jgi:hypothetical protein